VLEDLRHIRREIDTIGLLIRNGPKTLATDDPIVERIQDLVLSWAVTVRPGLAAIGETNFHQKLGDWLHGSIREPSIFHH
jgi:hypothetical protein